jgi:hypothetical protein
MRLMTAHAEAPTVVRVFSPASAAAASSRLLSVTFLSIMIDHDQESPVWRKPALVQFDTLKAVPAWLERGLARPAVQRGLEIPKRP